MDFHCCKLYRNEAPDVPEFLSLGLAYHFRPECRLSVRGPAELYGFTHWTVLALAYKESQTVLSPILAINVGASAPLIIKSFLSAAPFTQQPIDPKPGA